jgi:hypothetical protein
VEVVMWSQSDQQSTDWPCAAGRFGTRGAAISDELLIKALQPLSILQIGRQQPLLDRGGRAVASTNARTLEHGSYLLDRHEFDAIVLGSDIADGWPTVAYERLAEVAGSTPVLVQADVIGPMAVIKQRHDRSQDVIVAATAGPFLLKRLILAAILRSRALAADPGTQIG